MAAGGDEYLLRLHRPGKHRPGQVASELAWLEALGRDTDLAVPEPAAAPVVVAGVECSLLRWQHGRRMWAGARPVHLRRLGAAMARLHDHAEGWAPPAGFARPTWDWAGFFDVREWELVPPAHRTGWEDAADRAGELMARLEGGLLLIHADLHLDNVLFRHGEALLIDFDDCGFGHPIYDAAVALWELRWKDDWPAWREAFAAGYSEVRPLPPLEHLDTFIAARDVIFGLWFVARSHEHPGMRAKLDGELDYIAGSLERLLG